MRLEDAALAFARFVYARSVGGTGVSPLGALAAEPLCPDVCGRSD